MVSPCQVTATGSWPCSSVVMRCRNSLTPTLVVGIYVVSCAAYVHTVVTCVHIIAQQRPTFSITTPFFVTYQPLSTGRLLNDKVNLLSGSVGRQEKTILTGITAR